MELLTAIKSAARRDAEAFVSEFGEALDCDASDWGAVAWEGTSEQLRHAGLLTREDLRGNRFAATYDRLVARYTRGIAASAAHLGEMAENE